MKILLHTCCAPCIIYPLERLRSQGIQVNGFFYNPNIHPFSEYKNRKSALEQLAAKVAVEVIYPEYLPADFFRQVNLKEDKSLRCSVCWSLRLLRTGWEARQRGFEAFSTTLLVSPYQDHEELKKIGSRTSGALGINFYYEDFRSGFRKAHQQAHLEGIYCQKYCGCIYSEIERAERRVSA